MIEHHVRGSECLDAETLAAFIDGRLEHDARARAEAHLAGCEDCYEALVETTRVIEHEAPIEAGPRTRSMAASRWRQPKSWYALAGLAASILVGFLWFSPDARLGRAIDQLASARGSSRSTMARIHPSAEWSPAPETVRGEPNGPTTIAAREAILTIDRLAVDSESSTHLNARGLAALVSGQLTQSIDLLRQAAAAAPASAPIRGNLSAALFERWRQTASAEDLAGALDSAEIALRVSPQSPEALFNKALALEAFGQTNDAIEAWRAYLRVDPQSGWSREAQAHLNALTKAERRLSDQMERIRSGDAAVLKDIAATDATPLYNYLEDLLALWSRDPTTSLARGRVASNALIEAARDAVLPGLVNLAETSRTWPAARRADLIEVLTNRAAALTFFDETLYAEAASRTDIAAHAAVRSGLPALELNMLREQIRYYSTRDRRALEALASMEPEARRMCHWRILSRSLQIRGVQLMRDGRFADAGQLYETGSRVADAAGDQEARASLFAVRAELLIQQGQSASGWELNRRALEAAVDVRSYRRRHTVLTVAANSAEQTGLPGTGIVLAGELLRLAAEFNNPAAAVVAHLRRARAFALLGQLEPAVQEIDTAQSERPRISDPQLRASYQGEVSWDEGFILRKAEPDRAVRALDVALATFEKDGSPFRVAEILLARGDAHLGLGRPALAEQDWTRAVEVFEDQRPGIRDAQLRISRLSRLWDLFGSLVSLRTDRPDLALDTLERSRARALLDATRTDASFAPLQGAALHQWLPAGVTALAFSVHVDRLLVFAVTRQGVRLREHAISSRELSALVDRFVQDVRTHRTNDDGIRLSALLIPEDLDLRPESSLLLLPDGPLYNLPFGALPIAKRGKLLVQVCTPVVTPSLSVGERLSQMAWTTPRSVAIVAPQPDAASGLPMLRGAERETAALKTMYPVVTEAIGPGLKSAGVLKSMSMAAVVHFAGHAVTDDRFPSQSRLVVEGGPTQAGLTPQAISAGQVRPGALAILAACDTARGSVMRGEGALTLARSFLLAGASGVVGTLWQVNDEAAGDFLIEFHRALLAGDGPPFALAHAQRAAIDRGEPTVWPAFEILGGLHKGA